MSLPKMNRRVLKFWNARARAIPNRDWHVVVWGLVHTGSEWDGIHINIVWREIRTNCTSNRRANDLTRAIWDNRVQALKEENHKEMDLLDQALSGVRAEEPWALEPEYSYFEDEVSDE